MPQLIHQMCPRCTGSTRDLQLIEDAPWCFTKVFLVVKCVVRGKFERGCRVCLSLGLTSRVEVVDQSKEHPKTPRGSLS